MRNRQTRVTTIVKIFEIFLAIFYFVLPYEPTPAYNTRNKKRISEIGSAAFEICAYQHIQRFILYYRRQGLDFNKTYISN